MSGRAWRESDGALADYVKRRRQRTLDVYRTESERLEEDANTEERVLSSGYRYRQVIEVIQNASDAIQEGADEGGSDSGRIFVLLAGATLYVANTGAPLTEDGIVALLGADSSRKRKNQIGRFGLGFKSLLALGGKIDLFSRSVSVRFDPSACREAIRSELGLSAETKVPGLRMAKVIAFADEAKSDSHLRMLGEWATTVLRAQIKDPEMEERVLDELTRFRREFALFLTCDISLEMQYGLGQERRIQRERMDGRVVIHDGNQKQEWLTFERTVPVTDISARRDAGPLHDRDEVPMIWAVPLNPVRETAGEFWAFFHTDTGSRVPGIINAPWKIDIGRSALSPGDYNAFLMRAAADLVAEEIPKLCEEDDPGRVLDAFPRQLDREDELAAPLVHALWEKLQNVKVVPCGTGALRKATDLLMHPIDDPKLVASWHGLVKYRDQLHRLVHHTCLRGQRLARLNELWYQISRRSAKVDAGLDRLLTVLGRESELAKYPRMMEIGPWLEAASRSTVTDTKELLRFVGQLSESQRWPDLQENVARAEIVLADCGQMVAPINAIIGTTEGVPGTFRVDNRVLEDSESRDVLERVLSVSVLDDREWARRIRELVIAAPSESDDAVHERVWRAIREVPNAVLQELADVYDRIHIRSLDGLWRSRNQVVLPGRIIEPGDEGASSNSHLLVDMAFHGCENDSRIFQAMGVSDLPRSDWSRYQAESWVSYSNEMRAVYWHHLTDDQNPRQDSIGVIGRCRVPDALIVAHQATGPVKARIYSQFLDHQLLSHCQPVTIGHTGSNISRDRYPKVPGPHPFVWDIVQFGDIEFGDHLIPVGLMLVHFDSLRRIGNHPFRSLDRELEILHELIPDGYPIMKSASLKKDESVDSFTVLHMLANSFLNYRMSNDRRWEGSGFWAAVEAFCLSPTTGPKTARLIYEWMCESGRFPQDVCSASGIVSFQDCYVTSSSEMSAIAARANWPVVSLASATAQRWSEAGARALEESVKLEVGPDTKSSALLLDVAPEFRSVIKESAVGLARVRFVEHIRLSVEGGADYKALTWNSDQGTVLVDHVSFTGLDWQGQVEELFAAARRAGWVSGDLTEARQRALQETRAIRLRREVAEGSDLTERVLRLADCDAHRLLASFEEEERVAIPPAWMDDGLSLARLALRVYGPGVLHQLRELLVDRGLVPPSHWGTREAREFVSSLGFPPEFANAPSGRRASEVSVSGPMPLGPLHEFQKEIINDLKPILENKGMAGRGVISLPTGAGKTRVAVEASVRHLLRSDSVTGSVLWVAQTDELCEQAVQSFRQVWSSAGLEWTDLRIVRLWGGNPDPTPSPDGTPTVIVSSIQTLNSRLERLSLLDACALVMLDECHHAIAPSYTRLLNRLVPADGPPTSKAGPPVIGLTATPFRGRRSDEETRWLANRFAQRMFPRADRQPYLYTEFRNDGILSKHYFEPLHFNQPFDFTPTEREHISTYNELPASALNRLAGYTDRNHLIVQRTIQAAEDGPVLLFANSVPHARYLSTSLCVNGVEAASIYSETETAVRQYFIRRFQDGDLKVLTNYQVLSTGFDAPKVSTIVISRPVFTPSRYIQMVGRGLRGPKHGGTKECKIITVIDNLMEYQNRLAYHYFMDHYT